MNCESCGGAADERFSCYYGIGLCSGRPLVPAITCSCTSGTFWCYEDCYNAPPLEAPAPTIAPYSSAPAIDDSEVVQLIIENMMMKRERWDMKKSGWKLDDSAVGERKRRLRGG
jgi:hypothetical protein